MKGAYFIQTRGEDFNINAVKFLSIEIKDDVESFYIAYEARVKTPPTWLKGPEPKLDEYEELKNPQNPAEPYTLTLSTGDKLQLWRRKKAPAKSEIVRIPSNSYGNPIWQGLKSKPHPQKDNPYMYVVIIKPLTRPDWQPQYCTSKEFISNYCFENFARDYPGKIMTDIAEDLAKQEAGPLPSDQKFEIIKSTSSLVPVENCQFVNTIKSKTFSLQSRTYEKSSEIEFFKGQSQASVAITVEGQQKTYQKNVSGHLDFHYLLDDFNSMKTMQINSLNLQVDPMDTEIGTIDQINIRLLTSCEAACQDFPPPVLCNNYQIPVGDFACTESGRVDGQPLYFTTINTQPVDIVVDVLKKTFQLKPTGSFKGTIKAKDQDIPVTIDIDLKGKFVNFAPTVIVTKEYKPFAECVEKRNKTTITLLAKAIDPDGPLPSANFEWYQDYGLVTQKFWQKGNKLTINPNQLQYGAHLFTVVLQDTHGMRDKASVLVEVQDTTKPLLSIPPDIVLIQSFPHIGPTKIRLGEASAWDSCYQEALIRNDAPEDRIFSPGHTKVTWIADDLRGNSTTKVQNVFIIPIKDKFMLNLKDIAEKLQKAVQNSQEAIRESQLWPQSQTDLQTLTAAVQQFRDLVKDRSAQEGKEQLGQQIEKKLTPALTALQQANTLIQQANQADRRKRGKLRAQAAERLGQAQGLISAVMELSPPKKE